MNVAVVTVATVTAARRWCRVVYEADAADVAAFARAAVTTTTTTTIVVVVVVIVVVAAAADAAATTVVVVDVMLVSVAARAVAVVPVHPAMLLLLLLLVLLHSAQYSLVFNTQWSALTSFWWWHYRVELQGQIITQQESQCMRTHCGLRPQCAVNLDRNLKPKLAIMRQCTSVTDRRTDRRTLTS